MDGTGIKQQVVEEIRELAGRIALEIVTQAKGKFYEMFCALKEEAEQGWL